MLTGPLRSDIFLPRSVAAVLIQGPSGSGKTRMAYELGRRLRSERLDMVHSVVFRSLLTPSDNDMDWNTERGPDNKLTQAAVDYNEFNLLRLLILQTSRFAAVKVEFDPKLSLRHVVASMFANEPETSPTPSSRRPLRVLVLHIDEFQRNPNRTSHILRTVSYFNASNNSYTILPVLSGTWVSDAEVKDVRDVSTMATVTHVLDFLTAEQVQSVVRSAAVGAVKALPVHAAAGVITDDVLANFDPLTVAKLQMLIEDTEGWTQAAVQLGAAIGAHALEPVDQVYSTYKATIARIYTAHKIRELLGKIPDVQKLLLMALTPHPVRAKRKNGMAGGGWRDFFYPSRAPISQVHQDEPLNGSSIGALRSTGIYSMKSTDETGVFHIRMARELILVATRTYPLGGVFVGETLRDTSDDAQELAHFYSYVASARALYDRAQALGAINFDKKKLQKLAGGQGRGRGRGKRGEIRSNSIISSLRHLCACCTPAARCQTAAWCTD